MYLKKVAEMFNKNFKRYESDASAEVKAGAPVLEWSHYWIAEIPQFQKKA